MGSAAAAAACGATGLAEAYGRACAQLRETAAAAQRGGIKQAD
jgi:hypothetical protein